MGAYLGDDDWVARLARLDDVDAQAIPGGAGSLADVCRDATVLVFIANVVCGIIPLDGVWRGVWYEVM